MDNQPAPQTGDVPAADGIDTKPTAAPQTPADGTHEQLVDAPVVDNTTPAAPTWQELLDKVDARELRKHPKFAGILGSDLQRAIQQRDDREGQKHAQDTKDKEEKAFLELVDGNTDYIKEHHPLVYQRYQSLQSERATRDLENIRGKTIDELAEALGKAVQDVPEWKDFTPDDHEAIAKELIGKPKEQILSLFVKKAVEMFAEKRAGKKHDKWKASDLEKEREAIRKEISAQMLASSEAPDITRPKSKPNNAPVDVSSMPQNEFDKMWETLKKPK